MPWPTPAPGDISGRAASVYEGTPALAGIDARSGNTVASASCRVTEMAMTDLYFFQGDLAQELMPDTAQEWLSRHAAIWGVPQDQPAPAIGNATVTTTGVLTVAAGTGFTAPSGAVYAASSAATAASAGVLSVPLTASVAGSAGNQPAGTVLTPVSPIAGLAAQTATVDGNAISGGVDLESLTSWRSRILARIRQPPQGGATADYVAWAQAALSGVQYVDAVANATGLGTVTVAIAMSGPAAATAQDVTAVQNYLQTTRPVTAAVTVLAARLVPVNVTLHLNPDTTAIQAAATAALTLSFQQDGAIAGTTYLSRLNDAVSSSDGEYSHELIAPTADVAAAANMMNVLGTVSFV